MNKLQNIFAFTFILLIAISFWFCNAPHNNPLDSENSKNKIFTLEGRVKTIAIPQKAIANANILWEAENILRKSNQDGYFSITTTKQLDGWIKVNKEGYSEDSMFISWVGNKNIEMNFILNAKPQIESLQFYSNVINKYSKQKYSLFIKAKISDLENDIDTIIIENKSLNTSKKLSYNFANGFYERQLKIEDLNIADIDEVIGKDFKISVFDKNDKKFSIASTNIKRIIKREIVIDSPSGRDTVHSGKPFLEWRRFKPGFKYKYLAEIYTDEISEELVWTREISSEEINFNVEYKLPSGEYFWVLWAIDEFGNRCRSKEASFIVE